MTWRFNNCAVVVAAAAITLPAVSISMPAAADAAPATPRCHGHPATIVGTSGEDVVRGTRHRDVIAGLGGSDTIRGRGGNDVICGGPDEDRLVGGRGKDRLDGGASGDRLIGGPGADRVIDRKNGMYWDPREQDYAGTPNEFVEGPGRDVMRGRQTAETDVLTFRRSRVPVHLDWREGTARTDTQNEFSKVGVVVGTRFADVIRGRDGADEIHGGPGADTIDGRGGDDFLLGTFYRGEYPIGPSARDVLLGGDGDDELDPGTWSEKMGQVKGVGRGGTGDDFIAVAPAGGTYSGGAGDDDLVFDNDNPIRVDLGRQVASGDGFRARFGGAEKHTLWDYGGGSTIIGSDHADNVDASDATIDGKGGDDILTGQRVTGGPGDDRITTYDERSRASGGPGDDRMNGRGPGFGGIGDDTMVWDSGAAYGGDGNDTMQVESGDRTQLHGGPGDDRMVGPRYALGGIEMDGGTDVDTVTFARYEDERRLPLSIDLLSGKASDTRSSLTLGAIENVRGSRFGDTIIGDDGDNRLVGGPGDDSADGRGGTDTCNAESVTNCEN